MAEFYSLFEQFPCPALFVLPILGAIGLPMPEDAILLLCGLLISKRTVAAIPALLAVYSGILLSDVLLYSIGKKYGRQIVTHRMFRRILPPEKLLVFEDRFIQHGTRLILFGRQFFWFRAKLFLAAGIVRMPLKEFIIADAIAAVFTMAILVPAGYAGGLMWSFPDISLSAGNVTSLLTAVVAILMGWVFIAGRRKNLTTELSTKVDPLSVAEGTTASARHLP